MVALWCFLFVMLGELLAAEDVSLKLSGSSPHAVQNENFMFTCEVSHATNLTGNITFAKTSTNKTKEFSVELQQAESSCSVLKDPPAGYRVNCGNGTNNKNSSTKFYILVIDQSNSDDMAGWKCQTQNPPKSSNIIQLEVYYGPDSVTLNPPPPAYVKEGDTLSVECVATCVPACLYSFQLGAKEISKSSNLTLTNITRSQAGNYTCTATNNATSNSASMMFKLDVYNGPDSVTLKPPPPAYVKEGDTLSVECVANCVPACLYSFKLGTKEISKSSNLTLTNITRSQAGNYTCTATNNVTTDYGSVKFKLDIYNGPDSVILKPPPPAYVKEGDSLSVECVATCVPACSYSFKQGTKEISKSSSLTLTNITRSQAGNYSCTATNNVTTDYGSVKFKLDIYNVSLKLSGSSPHAELKQNFTFTCEVSQATNVTGKLTFTKTSTNKTKAFSLDILQGESSKTKVFSAELQQAEDSCSVLKDPPAGYSVSCGNGTNNSNSSTKSYTLVIDQPSSDDVAGFKCQTEHPPKSSNTIQLEVYYGPDSVILKPPPPAYVKEGDSLSVECVATCVPACSYSFKLGAKEISKSSNLTLTNITRSQAGNYTCTATNNVTLDYGSIKFKLDIHNVSVKLSGSSSHAELKQNFTFTCEVSQATNVSGILTFTKTSTNKIKLFSANILQAESSCSVLKDPPAGYSVSCGNGTNNSNSSTKSYTLVIDQPSSDDVAGFKCQTEHPPKSSNTIQLDVYYGPNSVKLKPPPPAYVKEGDTLSVECVATCVPACSYSFQLGTEEISKSSNLTLTNITRSQAGTYTCTATNNVTLDFGSFKFKLDIYNSPRLDERFPFNNKLTSKVGENATMRVFVIAKPTPTFTLYRLTNQTKKKLAEGGATNKTSSTATLEYTFVNLQLNDTGVYQIVVSNEAGDLVLNVTVTVQDTSQKQKTVDDGGNAAGMTPYSAVSVFTLMACFWLATLLFVKD